MVSNASVDLDGDFDLCSFTLPHYEWEPKGAVKLAGYRPGGKCIIYTEDPSWDIPALHGIVNSRRHEIIGWLLDNGERRTHSTTIEATTDDEAVAVARRYSLPPYSWRLQRVNRLEDKAKIEVFKDKSIDDISEDMLVGNKYIILGWILDYADSHADDEPVLYLMWAQTDKEAIAKSNHLKGTRCGYDQVFSISQIIRIEDSGKKVAIYQNESQPLITKGNLNINKELQREEELRLPK